MGTSCTNHLHHSQKNLPFGCRWKWMTPEEPASTPFLRHASPRAEVAAKANKHYSTSKFHAQPYEVGKSPAPWRSESPLQAKNTNQKNYWRQWKQGTFLFTPFCQTQVHGHWTIFLRQTPLWHLSSCHPPRAASGTPISSCGFSCHPLLGVQERQLQLRLDASSYYHTQNPSMV